MPAWIYRTPRKVPPSERTRTASEGLVPVASAHAKAVTASGQFLVVVVEQELLKLGESRPALSGSPCTARRLFCSGHLAVFIRLLIPPAPVVWPTVAFRPTEASKAAVRYVRSTSTQAV
jgi:hypothetical protein